MNPNVAPAPVDYRLLSLQRRMQTVRERGLRFDEELPVLEDWDFWLQLTEGADLVHCPGVSAVYRQGLGQSALGDPEHPNHWRVWHRRLLERWASKNPPEVLAATLAWNAMALDRSQSELALQVTALKAEIPQLRVLSHQKNSGQSRSVRSGILAARAPIIVTMDGDGQNDPADAPRLAERLKAAPQTLSMVGGERVKRQDSNAKRFASRFGNGVRGWLLKDGALDTGCGLKAFRREAFLRLPYFDHIHRYLPALMIREGYEIAFEPVNHRHRETGVSKYTNFGRLKASVSDLLGVLWLQSRSRLPGSVDEA
jgi:glycosyltransferase involved in cell wall biosynthesis